MKKPIYLDYFTTTPVDPSVFEAMRPFFCEIYGNAHSRNHSFGWQAEEAVEKARKQTATLIGARAKNIVFTSGATESNNLAIKGVVELLGSERKHIVTVATEHKSVLMPLLRLRQQGFDVSVLPVQANGLLDLDRLRSNITRQTFLVSVMCANNEIGVIQPIREIARIAQANGALFHCDATQAVGKIPVDVNLDHIDLLTLSGHKIYGPKGVGALYVRRQGVLAQLPAQIDGGGQEFGLRAGTLNVPGIVGLGAACKLAHSVMHTESARMAMLRDHLQHKLTSALDNVKINSDIEQRLPNLLSVSFAGVDIDSLLHSLKGIAVSSGSACAASSNNPSHVLIALGMSDMLARSTLRFGLGCYTTMEEIDYVSEKIITIIKLK
jgi:cysteine desulfurase